MSSSLAEMLRAASKPVSNRRASSSKYTSIFEIKQFFRGICRQSGAVGAVCAELNTLIALPKEVRQPFDVFAAYEKRMLDPAIDSRLHLLLLPGDLNR